LAPPFLKVDFKGGFLKIDGRRGHGGTLVPPKKN